MRTYKPMEENHFLVVMEKAVPLPQPPSSLKPDADNVEDKKPNCLCAPTTHAGSFRCRLHRRPPQSPKVKAALHHKPKQGLGKRAASFATSSRLQQQLPGLSRLSRTSTVKEQKSQSDQEALTTVLKTSTTGDDALECVNPLASEEEPSSAKRKSYIRPLVKLPSI